MQPLLNSVDSFGCVVVDWSQNVNGTAQKDALGEKSWLYAS